MGTFQGQDAKREPFPSGHKLWEHESDKPRAMFLFLLLFLTHGEDNLREGK